MRSVVCLLSSFLVVKGGRVVNVNDNAEELDFGEVLEHDMSEDVDVDDEDEAAFKKWERTSSEEMQKRFSSPDEKVLMDDEVVELAWKQGKFDYLLFTNKRFMEADGKGMGKKPSKVSYTSGLWRTLGSWSVETIGGGMDRDVELTLHDAFHGIAPGHVASAGSGKFTKHDAGKMAFGAALGSIFAESEAVAQVLGVNGGTWKFDFHKKEDIMEINKYVEKKVLEAKAWQAANNVALQKAQSVMFKMNSKHQIPNTMSRLKPISNDEGEKVLSKDGKFLMDGEKLLYSFTENRWKRDHIYLTNKRSILADRKMGTKKTHYVSVPHDDKPFNMIAHWEVETAGPMDADCELKVGTITGHHFDADFSKKFVSTKDLFAMQMDLQKQIF